MGVGDSLIRIKGSGAKERMEENLRHSVSYFTKVLAASAFARIMNDGDRG
jgi:hypothetical protein